VFSTAFNNISVISSHVSFIGGGKLSTIKENHRSALSQWQTLSQLFDVVHLTICTALIVQIDVNPTKIPQINKYLRKKNIVLLPRYFL